MINLSSPVALVWEITNNCNLKCPHCRAYMDCLPRDKDVERRVFQQIEFNHILSVNLSGGEPLLHPEVVSFVQRLSSKNIDVGISTNGWLYENYAYELKEAGLNFVQISLDGPESVHDSFRGVTGSYARAVKSIRTALSLGHYVQMNITLTAYNLRYIFDAIHVAEALGVSRVFLRRVVSAGLGKVNKGVLPNREEYLKTLRELLLYREKSNTTISIDDPIIKAIKPQESSEETLSCSAGITSLGIDSAGNVYPCIFLRESLGNIKENDMASIWRESSVLKRLRERDIEICGDCEYKFSCGGCRAYAGIFSKDSMCPLSESEKTT